MLTVWTHQVVPHRSELGLRPGSVLFRSVEHRLCLRLVACRLELQILSGPVQVGDAGALDRERLLLRKARPVVTDQTARAFLQRVIGEIGFPLDDGRRLAEIRWEG